jgi:soluble lytic murein transglycosylase
MLRMIFLALLALLAPAAHAADTVEQRALFLKAEQALSQGRNAEARQQIEALAGYPLQPYLLAKYLAATPGAAGEIPAFLDANGQTRYAEPLRRKWLDSLAQRESWAEYGRYYRETDNPQGRCQFYRALHALGRSTEAFAGAAALWASGETMPAACDPLFAAWQATREFTEDKVWQRLGAALAKNKTALASSLRGLLPESRRGLADLWIEVHNDPQKAAECRPWDFSEPLSGSIFAHGVDRLAAKEPQRAASLWNFRRSEFPLDSAEAARIDRRLGLAFATGRHPEAAAHLASLPDAASDGDTRIWRVRSALWNENWPGALLALGRLNREESEQPAWRYWRARSLEALADRDGALGLYGQLAGEREFYGFLAADRVGRDYPLNFSPSPVTDAELRRLAESEAFGAIREFRALSRPGEAQKEWVHTIASLPPADLALAARLAATWGWHRLSILTAAKAGIKDDLALRFPLAFEAPVTAQARERQLDRAVVFGLIRRESAFDPAAKSPVGALGLMQIMPATGQTIARQLNEPWRAERSLLDPNVNIRYGTAYFRALADRFGGNLAMAAAGYNAGPGRAERWRPVARPIPADIWIETIPFNETRQYVAAVLSYATIYRQRLGEAPVRTTELLPDIAASGRTPGATDQPAPVAVCR